MPQTLVKEFKARAEKWGGEFSEKAKEFSSEFSSTVNEKSKQLKYIFAFRNNKVMDTKLVNISQVTERKRDCSK